MFSALKVQDIFISAENVSSAFFIMYDVAPAVRLPEKVFPRNEIFCEHFSLSFSLWGVSANEIVSTGFKKP